GIEPEHWVRDAPGFLLTGSLRATLGAVAFNRAHAKGLALTVDEAVAEALTYTLPAPQSPDTREPVPLARRHGLSPRELEVLRLMTNGLSNQQIADELFLSLRTITTHVTGILSKLNLTSRTQAVSFAIRSGIA
ncbi:MAG: response regulator transcription factor, partial [Chloroflexia bacterium]|nr:response regulator transcription factor [Chloroflexia bacterium]